MKAGQAVPLRWSLLDQTGAPILDLAMARVTSTRFDCETGGVIDQIEEVTAGGSGLLHIGSGQYQLNWKTSSAHAGTCRTLHLDLGDGVLHDALFRFTK